MRQVNCSEMAEHRKRKALLSHLLSWAASRKESTAESSTSRSSTSPFQACAFFPFQACTLIAFLARMNLLFKRKAPTNENPRFLSAHFHSRTALFYI